MTSRDLRWPEVTQKWRHLTGSQLEVALEGRKLTLLVRFIPNKAVAHKTRQSRDRKCCHVTSGDLKWPGSDFIWPEVTWKWLERPKTRIVGAFHLLQGCSSQEEAVTWQKMTSHDLRLLQMTRKWHRLTGSYLEVAVEGRKFALFVRFTSYKAIAHRNRESRDRK